MTIASALHAVSRRRGDALLEAIYAATLDELSDHGFEALTMEGVAERAQTGKASLYRRWHSKVELVVDALDHTLPTVDTLPNTGSLREDLLGALRAIAKVMNSRAGTAAKACMFAADVGEEVRQRVLEPRKAHMVTLLERGVARGEVRPEAATLRIAEVGPALLQMELMRGRGRIPDRTIVAIVDEVLIPLLQPR